jgi:hypothetical protein
MKTIGKIIIAALVVGFTTTSFAQKIKMVSGDLKFLKGETKVNIKYDWSGMKVGKMEESVYVSQKVEEKNKKEAGTGDTWKGKWEADKTDKFEPKFEELLNKYLDDKGMTAGQDTTGTKYTIILKTTMLDPGYNVGVSRKPAYINVEIDFVANSAPTVNLAKMTMTKVPGQDAMGYDYDTGYRIGEAFAKCGKSLGAYIKKNAFK